MNSGGIDDNKAKDKPANRLSFRLSSIQSPTRKGLLDSVTKTFSPSRRPATPSSVTKVAKVLRLSECEPSSRPSAISLIPSTPSRTLTQKPSPQKSYTSALLTEASETAGVHSWSDNQLARKYSFKNEIGCGNWGSCWSARDRSMLDEGDRSNIVAIKLVYRKNDQVSNARVKALWNEYKVLQSCGKPLHRNLVDFKEFIISPSYALVVMKYYRQAMNVALPVSTYGGASGYFQQLLSSVAWLHSENVTHCDIKVANLLVDTSQDKIRGHPILVDFGFATLHDETTRFKSKQNWGTPEYLSPERSKGEWHDERMSDIWALGVTFFEIATGRTPFEHEDEQFLNKDELEVYRNRTMKSRWVGHWTIPLELHELCRTMLRPDPVKRIDASEALHSMLFTASINELQSTMQIRSDNFYPTMLVREADKNKPKGKEREKEQESIPKNNTAKAACDIDEASRPNFDRLEPATVGKMPSLLKESAQQSLIAEASTISSDFPSSPIDNRLNTMQSGYSKVNKAGCKDHSDQKVKGDDYPKQLSRSTVNRQGQDTAVPLKHHNSPGSMSSRQQYVSTKGAMCSNYSSKTDLRAKPVEEVETFIAPNESSLCTYSPKETECDVRLEDEYDEKEELAAQLDEMGALAQKLAAMVQESKGKLSQMQEASILKSPRAIYPHPLDKQSTPGAMKKASSHSRRASFSSKIITRASRFTTEVQDAASTEAIQSSPPPVTMIRSSGINSLRRKLSHSLMGRKEPGQSKIPFPSGIPHPPSNQGRSNQADNSGIREESLDESIMQTPRTPRRFGDGTKANITRASSTRGRTLSQFLTRYGVKKGPNTLDSTAETGNDSPNHHMSPPTPLQPQAKAVPIAILSRGSLVECPRLTEKGKLQEVGRQELSIVSTSTITPQRSNRPLSQIYQVGHKTPIHHLHCRKESVGMNRITNEITSGEVATISMPIHTSPEQIHIGRPRQESHIYSTISQGEGGARAEIVKTKSQRRPISSSRVPSTSEWQRVSSAGHLNITPLKASIDQDPAKRESDRKVAHRSFIPVSPRGNLWNRIFRNGGNTSNIGDGSFILLP